MVLIAMGGVVVVVVVMIQYQGRSPHFNSIHKWGEWMLALIAARWVTLEEVEVVVCVLVVVVVLISTVEFPQSSSASPLLLLVPRSFYHGHPLSAPGEVNLYMMNVHVNSQG